MTYTVPLVINGLEVHTDLKLDISDPTSGKLLWHSSAASAKEVNEAINAAKAAFPSWSKTNAIVKRNILLAAADIFDKKAVELSGIVKSESGCPDIWADVVTAPAGTGLIRDVAGRIATITSIVPTMRDENSHAIVYKEPYGVVLAIAPWNAPYYLGIRAIIFALATGNTVVMKGSELSPRSFWFIASVFQEAGLPDGVLNFLICRQQDAAELTKAIVEHEAIRKISFTGSSKVGSIIASLCGKNLKPCILELGGKASAIILDDAELQNAAFQCALGSFVNAGQVCMSTERIIVHKAIAPAFSTALLATIGQVFPADGPAPVLISRAGAARTRTLVDDALSKGAKLLFGSIDAQEGSLTHIRPIVLEGVNSSMDICYQETFGPVVSFIVVENEEEAIKLANDTEYGLSSSVFTQNLETALRVARNIESGAIHINKMTIFDDPNVPHGGVKSSGFGRFNGDIGMNEFLKTKGVTWNSM
ncbi:Vanillin dehydrogenase [Lachnellula subtilissima]|uniref:Vanillin dehydrogenase n=1 Tax=Lachnellula subtilissima TaxID=602034 RepID=A0A8H8RIB4_9HELO|nr:Vanillin dehydrogenase [Lachnellula subtilissima]